MNNPFCISSHFILSVLGLVGLGAPSSASDWPQWQGPQRDGTWPEKGIISEFPSAGPKVQWRAAVGLGYSGPAVVGESVYVMDYLKESGEVSVNPGGRSKLTGKERLLCFDRSTGKAKWQQEWKQDLDLSFPNGPRCTPAVGEGKVVALGAEGMMVCVDAASGKRLWQKDLKAEGKFSESPIWGFSSHPLISNGLVYALAGGADGVVLALDLATGAKKWGSVPCAQPGYAPPMMSKIGGQDQLLAFFPKGLAAVDPASGKVNWTVPFEPAYDMSIMQPTVSEGVVMVSGIVKKNMGVKLPATATAQPEEAWSQVNRSISAKNGTPIAYEGHFFACDADGELKCIKASTGELVWEEPAAINGRKGNSGTFFMARIAETPRVVIYNENGELVLGEISTTKGAGWKETARAKVLEPTTPQMGKKVVVWSAPAFAHGSAFVRNDKELISIDLRATR